jgi:hypothetical protein
MKIVRYLGGCVLFIAVFFIGLWTFAPWDGFGLLAFEELRAAAARSGYYVTCASIRREGLFPPRYRVFEMDVEGPMTKITFSEATLTIEPIRIAVLRKAAFSAEFSGADVRYIPKNGFAMSFGKARIAADSKILSLDDMEIEGDLKMSGRIVIDASSRNILESEAVMNVPPELNMILNAPMLSRFVEPVSPGKWRIKANAPSNR